MGETLAGLNIIIVLFLFILAVLWFFLPFAIFGTKEKLTELIIEVKKINSELSSKVNETFSEKICPQCAEPVKKDAKICRYCGSKFVDTPGNKDKHTNSGTTNNDEELMKRYDITYTNEKYQYKEYSYDSLNDAVNYAKKQ